MDGVDCETDEYRYCVFGTNPAFGLTTAMLAIQVINHIYQCLVLYQHVLNKREGMGDGLHQKSKEIPEYLLR